LLKKIVKSLSFNNLKCLNSIPELKAIKRLIDGRKECWSVAEETGLEIYFEKCAPFYWTHAGYLEKYSSFKRPFKWKQKLIIIKIH